MGFDFDGKNQDYQRDAYFKGTCDEGVKKLAELCGFKVIIIKNYTFKFNFVISNFVICLFC
jgi:hypothetical protein